MKKTVAIRMSVLFYIGAFMLIFLFSIGNDIRWFLFGLPMMVAVYFVIAGNIFSHRLKLNRWYLWLSMNFIGGLFSWIILLICFSVFLFNGFILFLFVLVTCVFAVVWSVVGLGFLCAKCFKRYTVSPKRIEKFTVTRPKRAGAWNQKAKIFIGIVGVLLLILAAASLCMGVSGFFSIRPVTCYEDSGIHTFAPYDLLPVQVKSSGSSRYQRMNPTRTVYMVYYQATDGTGYRWQVEGGSVRELVKQLYNRGPVERRVLSIPADNTYITVEADQTAESYTTGLQQKYILIMGVSGGYILLYLVAWVVIWFWKKREEGKEDLI